MNNTDHTTQTVYLFPQEEHRYGATVSAETPSIEGAVKLADVKNYPVDVFYSRTDLNGSLCYEADHCKDQAELLASLNWCGRCRYTILQLWDFDLDKTKDAATIELLDDASRYRLSLIAKEWDSLSEEEEDLPQDPLSDRIHAARQRAASSENHTSQIPQEPIH